MPAGYLAEVDVFRASQLSHLFSRCAAVCFQVVLSVHAKTIAPRYMPVNSMLRIAVDAATCYVVAMDAKEIRVANLRRYIRERAENSQAEFARRYGMSAAHISQLLTRHRDVGDKLAREIEGKLGLDRGEMDRIDLPVPIDPSIARIVDIYAKLSEDGRDQLLGAANRIYSKESAATPPSLKKHHKRLQHA